MTATITVPLQETITRRSSYPAAQIPLPPDGLQGRTAQNRTLHGPGPGSGGSQPYASPISCFPVDTACQTFSRPQAFMPTHLPGETCQQYAPVGYSSNNSQPNTLSQTGQTSRTYQPYPQTAGQVRSSTSQSYSTSGFTAKPWHNSNPFVVLKLNNRVKRCCACHLEFRSPAGPPFIGLVVRHVEHDQYRDKYGQFRLSSEANHYYHCTMQCIKCRHPFFHPGLLQVEGADDMDEIQIDYLKKIFGS